MSTEVLLDLDGPIGRITFNSPNGVHLLSMPTMAALEARLGEITRHPEVRILIITGEGRTFMAGADIDEMSTMPEDAGRAFSQRGQRFMLRLARFEQAVTIAAINGPALGGGAEVALACDLRIIAEEATIGFPEVKLGLIPGWGGTQRAFALVGGAMARKLLFSGRPLTGPEAAVAGLVSESVPANELMKSVEAMAGEILSNGPTAVRLLKRVVCAEEVAWLEKGLQGEAEAFGEAFLSEEGREGLRAFLDKRPPRWAKE